MKTEQRKSLTTLLEISLPSEYTPLIWMQEGIINTPTMDQPAFESLYSEQYLRSSIAEWAQGFISTLNSTLMGDFNTSVLKAWEYDLEPSVKQTSNKLHYCIEDCLLIEPNINGYQNLYIPAGALEKWVSPYRISFLKVCVNVLDNS